MSNLIENNLKSITESNTKEITITSLVASLMGLIELSAYFNDQTNYTDYLIDKY